MSSVTVRIGAPSHLSSPVPLPPCRPKLQAAEGPLRELPSSELVAGVMDGLGRPALDRLAESTREELEDDRAGDAWS